MKQFEVTRIINKQHVHFSPPLENVRLSWSRRIFRNHWAGFPFPANNLRAATQTLRWPFRTALKSNVRSSKMMEKTRFSSSLAEWRCRTSVVIPALTSRILLIGNCPLFHMMFSPSMSIWISLSCGNPLRPYFIKVSPITELTDHEAASMSNFRNVFARFCSGESWAGGAAASASAAA